MGMARTFAATAAQARSFGLLVAGSLALAAVWAVRIEASRTSLTLLIVGSVVSVSLALANASLLIAPCTLWLRIGNLLGRVFQPVMLATLFLFVLTPYALVLRALGRDVLGLRARGKASTYWVRRAEPGFSASSFKRQY